MTALVLQLLEANQAEVEPNLVSHLPDFEVIGRRQLRQERKPRARAIPVHLQVEIRDAPQLFLDLGLIRYPFLFLVNCLPVENQRQQVWILLVDGFIDDPPSISVFVLRFCTVLVKQVHYL